MDFALNVHWKFGDIGFKVFSRIMVVDGNQQHWTGGDETTTGFEPCQPRVVAETPRQVYVHATITQWNGMRHRWRCRPRA